MRQASLLPVFLLLSGLCLLGAVLLFTQGQAARQAYTTASRLQEQVDTLARTPQILAEQEVMLGRMSRQLSVLQSRKEEVQSHLSFDVYLDQLCQQKGVQIVAFPQEKREQVQGFSISEEHFRLSGKYHQLIQVCYALEQSDRIGAISKTHFELQTVGGLNRMPVLTAEIWLRRLESQGTGLSGKALLPWKLNQKPLLSLSPSESL